MHFSIGFVALILIAAFGYLWFAEDEINVEDNAVPVVVVDASASEEEANTEYVAPDLSHIKSVTLPAGAPQPPIVSSCALADDRGRCEISRAEIGRVEWPKAWQGDYQAQRNIAFCYSDSCGGSVDLDPIAACAWRYVIMRAGHPDADESDIDRLDFDCGNLEAIEQQASIAKAQGLFRRIFNREMPAQ